MYCLLCNLFSIPKLPLPFDTLHLDHLGPLPQTKSRKKYILVIINAFTKFTKLYATFTTNTNEVCDALNQYITYYSRPKRIVSYRSTCFTSNLFKEYLESHNISYVLNASGSPQANDQVERVNRVLRLILSKLSDLTDHSDWSSHLRSAEYALNNTVHSSTGFLPSVLLFALPHDRYVFRDVEGCQNTQMAYNGVLEVDKFRKWVTNI